MDVWIVAIISARVPAPGPMPRRTPRTPSGRSHDRALARHCPAGGNPFGEPRGEARRFGARAHLRKRIGSAFAG